MTAVFLVVVSLVHLATCVKEFDVSLEGWRATSTRGTINIYYQGHFHYICDKYIDLKIADVICIQLGLLSGEPTFGSFAGNLDLDFKVMPRALQCEYGMKSLSECQIDRSRIIYDGEASGCLPRRAAGVKCRDPPQASVRLVRGTDMAGTVELWQHMEWGAIEDTGWDDRDATVVCRQLGYDRGGKAVLGAHYGPATTDNFWISNVDCQGSESNLVFCKWSLPSKKNHSNDAGVECLSDSTVRLVDGGRHSGTVQVHMGGVWVELAYDELNERTARVVCRTALDAGTTAIATSVSCSSKHVWKASCTGRESSLFQCPTQPLQSWDTAKDCELSVMSVLRVTCNLKPTTTTTTTTLSPATTTVSEGSLRLADGGPGFGRVEIYYYSHWGTICDDGWGDEEARVVCQTLGFSDFGKAKNGGFYGQGRGSIWLTDVDCSFRDLSFRHCRGSRPRSVYGVTSCTHKEDAAVDCTAKPKDGGSNKVTVGVAAACSALLLILILVLIRYVIKRHQQKQRDTAVRYAPSTESVSDFADLENIHNSMQDSVPPANPARVESNSHQSVQPSAPPDEQPPPSYQDLIILPQHAASSDSADPPSYESLFDGQPKDMPSSVYV